MPSATLVLYSSRMGTALGGTLGALAHMGHYADERTLSDVQPCHTRSCALRVSNVPNEMPAYGMIPT